MIIAIGGKIASGKNTVCDIIQDLCKKHNGPNFEQKAFAGKLKQIASLLTGIPVEKFEDQEFKKTILGEEWGTVKHNPLNAIPVFEDVQFNDLMSVREFLQRLGTEAMRDGLHTNVWVNALFADYKPQDAPYKHLGDLLEDKHHGVLNNPNWIITDMRFPNEMDAVIKRKGITIRVVRQEMHSLQAMVPAHASETALDDAKFDYEIINDGTIEDLIEKVRALLIKENII
jgi:hypothetical protein